MAVASFPALTHDDDDDKKNGGGDCEQASGASFEVLTMSLQCSLEDGVRVEMEGTGDVGNIGEAGGAGPIASCLDLVNSLLSQMEGCVAGELEDIYGNGGLYGSIICSGDRNQVVNNLSTFLVGIQSPAPPISVIDQPAEPRRR